MKYKITIEYDGTSYLGWSNSIDKAIEKAIQELTKENIKIYGAGRTDAGVHALGQTAHFVLQNYFEPNKLMNSLNYFLRASNETIILIDCKIVDDEFHARFSAIKRYYKYLILNRPQSSVILKNKVLHVHKKIDIDSMQKCLPLLIGKNDWSSFRGSNCQSKSPIKTVDKVELKKNEDIIIFTMEAKSFLYHQVRNTIGTLLNVGLGKRSIDDFENIILSKDRTKAGKTADACGLYLEKIDY
ncbi:MAG: tRNA pseudouridine(38-40) synthase TruA [Rickettsiales bacterium]|jgi:tRNA pseudouridine38-40 synthase|nr:tRNA pseudouridine(38-40) synthase TruA [Rickettsiales bacterium]